MDKPAVSTPTILCLSDTAEVIAGTACLSNGYLQHAYVYCINLSGADQLAVLHRFCHRDYKESNFPLLKQNDRAYSFCFFRCPPLKTNEAAQLCH